MCVTSKMWKLSDNMFIMQCLFVLIIASFADCLQKFIEVPAYTEVNPNKDALLKCRVADKKGSCSWQKDNKPVGIHRGKYEWADEGSTTDCSLWVRSATLHLDDGQWQCQVTASNFDSPDALSSPPAPLAVREPPQTPRILFNGSHILPTSNITVDEGNRATVVCEARYGNPPATLAWYLEDERLISWSQTNSSELDKPRLWGVRSVLELAAKKERHGKQLTCRAYHPSYPTPGYKDAYALVDVTYAPTVSIAGADGGLGSLEEGNSVLALECKADGNPQPYAWWSRGGQALPTTGSKLILAPLERNHTGIYTCQAKNSVGISEPTRIDIDVKFPPEVVYIGPGTVVEANLFTPATITCKAEGNPPPIYQWLHDVTPLGYEASVAGPRGYVVGNDAELVLPNVTYRHHGQYICVARNTINGKERSSSSTPVTLSVLGPPVWGTTIGGGSGSTVATGREGGMVSLGAVVCALPPPTRAMWTWGSRALTVPGQIGRFRALAPVETHGCYRYTLSIEDALREDARTYQLHVENDRGSNTHTITVTLVEKTQLAPLIGAGFVVLVLVIVIICLIRKCKTKKDTVEYKANELDSEKSTPLPADAVYAPAVMRSPPPPAVSQYTQPRVAQRPTRAPYSPEALQRALEQVKREAKDNLYSILEPHVKYDISINKVGKPSTFISLTKPLGNDLIINGENSRNDPNRFSYKRKNEISKYPYKSGLKDRNKRRSDKSYASDRSMNYSERSKSRGDYSTRSYNSRSALDKRPKSLQNVYNSEYLDHIFREAVVI